MGRPNQGRGAAGLERMTGNVGQVFNLSISTSLFSALSGSSPSLTLRVRIDLGIPS